MPPTTFIFAGTEAGLNFISFAGEKPAIAPPVLTGKTILSIAVDAGHPLTMLACTTAGIFRSTDGGRIWTAALSVPGAAMTTAPNLHPVWVGAQNGELWRGTDAGSVWENISAGLYATDAADDWFPPFRADTPSISAVAYDAKATVLLAGITFGGMMRSVDRGAQWTEIDVFAGDAIRHIAAPAAPGGVWLARTEEDLFFSADDGITWQEMQGGMAHDFCTALVAHPSGRCWAAAGAVPPGNWVENAITELYRADRAGEPWRAIALPQPAYITALATMPSGNKIVVGTQNGSIYVGDGESPWEKIVRVTGSITTLHVVRIG